MTSDDRPPTNSDSDRRERPGADLIDTARQAENLMRRLAHQSLRAPALEPTAVDAVLSHIAEIVAALPQVASQLGGILDRSQDTHLLAMDGMTATTDLHLAVDTARHHLDQLRGPSVEAYRHLSAARRQAAHISATAPG